MGLFISMLLLSQHLVAEFPMLELILQLTLSVLKRDCQAVTTTASRIYFKPGLYNAFVRTTLRLLRRSKSRVSCGPGVAAVRLLSSGLRRRFIPKWASLPVAIWLPTGLG